MDTLPYIVVCKECGYPIFQDREILGIEYMRTHADKVHKHKPLTTIKIVVLKFEEAEIDVYNFLEDAWLEGGIRKHQAYQLLQYLFTGKYTPQIGERILGVS